MKKKLLLVCYLCMITQLIIAQIPTGAVAQYNFSNNYDDAIGNADITSSAAGSYAQDRFTNVLSSLRVQGRQHNGYAFSGSQTELSVAFWMRIPAGDAGTQRIIQTFDQSGDGFKITFDGSSQILQVDFVHPNGNNYVGSANVSGLNLKGSWHHMALVIKHIGSSFENRLYIDSVENSAISNAISVNNISPNFINSSAVFQISPASFEDYFGIIDDIIIFERGLTAAEIGAIYNDPNPNVCTVNITDANFKAALVAISGINTNGDSEIQCDEAANFTGFVDVSGNNISDVTGIESFVNSRGIYLFNNNISTLDISSLPNLEFADIGDNNISSLDLSNNTSLIALDANGNDFTSLVLPSGNNLERVQVNNSQLSNLDVSNVLGLELLNLANNNLANGLDLSNNILLESLNLSGNGLNGIDVSSNTALLTLGLSDNNLSTLDLSTNSNLRLVFVDQNNLSSLDVSSLSNLSQLLASLNDLTNLNLANGNNTNLAYIDALDNSNLTCIQVDAGFTPPSVWDKDATTSYSDNCSAASCTVNIPDVNFKAALVNNSMINTNGDTEIQCSEAAAFTGTVGAFGASISDATGVEAFVNTTVITFEQNSLTSIDLSANVNLEELYLDGNNLTSLDLTANIMLRDIRVESNQISSLILPNTNTLISLRGSNNQLNSIDLSNSSGLESITLINNSLSAIDLSNQTLLDAIYLNDNNLSSIDLSNNPELSIIYLERNDLGVIDISANPMTTILSLAENELTSLDISNGANTVLNTFSAISNPDLTCIEIDSGFTPPSTWIKDTTANYSDNCSNTADITDPIAVCQDVTIQLDANGVATLTAAQVDNGSSDDVGVASIAIDITSFDCSNVGTTTVTLTVTDAAGNSDTCTATITVEDNVVPTITCPADETVTVDEGDQYTIPNYSVSYQDNCSATVSQSPAAGTTIGAGVQTITFTATDPSGNSVDCSFDLTVEETLSVEDDFSINVNVYPNPVRDILTIETQTPVESVGVYSITGQKVMHATGSQVEMNALAKGIYFINIKTQKGSAYKRVIKQ